LRLEAAARFARGGKISRIAHDLRVTPGSVRRWHRAWEEGGTGALRSRWWKAEVWPDIKAVEMPVRPDCEGG
jgi:transposase-like protein